MYLHGEPPKVVEEQMNHILAGLFINLKKIAVFSEDEARHELARLVGHLVAFCRGKEPGGSEKPSNSAPSQN